jgi:hypothetical protein
MRQPVLRPDAAITLPRPTATTGRPTTLTDDVANKILLAIKGGSYRTVAAQWAGIASDQFSRWMMRDDEPYATFRKAVEAAEAHSELKAVTSVTKAADADAKYAVAFLERRFPVRWARAVPSTSVNIDLGSMLAKIHERIRSFHDPREARRALTTGAVLDVEGRALPHDPRPLRASVRQPVQRQPVQRHPVTVLPPTLTDERDEMFDGERDVEQID